jgi:hypothetical protein
MGIYLGPFRFTKRGVRVRVGPRVARLHFGAGGTGFSTGAGAFTAYKSLSGTKRRRTATAERGRPVPAPKVATETEKVRLRQAIRHAIESAEQDAFELAMARYLDLARTKAGADNLGSIGEIKMLTQDESGALQSHLQVIRDCLGQPDKLAVAQAAAEQYNLLADKANRRIDMIMHLGAPNVSDEDRLDHIEVS